MPKTVLSPPKCWVNQDSRRTGEVADLHNQREYAQDFEPGELPYKVINDLVISTFKNITTSDRKNTIPAGVSVVDIRRLETGSSWRKYAENRYRIREKRAHPCTPIAKICGKTLLTDVSDTVLDGSLQGRVNEVYLWHGCSVEAASGIAKNGFDMSRCGSGAGSMYGPGSRSGSG